MCAPLDLGCEMSAESLQSSEEAEAERVCPDHSSGKWHCSLNTQTKRSRDDLRAYAAGIRAIRAVLQLHGTLSHVFMIRP